LYAFHRPLLAAALSAALAASVLNSSPAATADANHEGSLVVHRNAAGTVEFIDTTSGGVDASRGTRVQAAWGHLDRVAATLGVDDPTRDFEAGPAVGTIDGGSVVRFQQRLSGLPVLGGEVLVGMDAEQALTSVTAHRSKAQNVAPASYDVARARQTARLIVAKADRVGAGQLDVGDRGTWVYDGNLLGASSPGARSVYRFEVGNGSEILEFVLVDAVNGRVLLHYNQVAEALNRRVCDDKNAVNGQGQCTYQPAAARLEGGAESAVSDVNAAYDVMGATAQFYAETGGIDLTSLIGQGSVSYPKSLAATVRWCPTPSEDPTCPMQNAYWAYDQMWIGDSWAAADDVIGHELTHGVIEKYADLFYFHESGAINESLADVMGEIIDHRNPSPSDVAGDWSLGEDLPGGALRSMSDPTAYGQPDKMTSSLYAVDSTYSDNGGVHSNSGIGNKTAYLISQGGSFNGYDVTGIDAGDPTLTKSATLYLDVIQHLVSGSQYDDLGRVLVQSCQSLAASGTVGFSATDCDQVLAATRATELALQPTVEGAGRPAEAPDGCPDGTTKRALPLGSSSVTPTSNPLWFVAPNDTYGIPANAREGTTSNFGFDPDPHTYGDPYASTLTRGATTLPAGQPSYLRFDQWRLFEWTSGSPATYNDGGLVRLSADDGTGTYSFQDLDASWWDNGPQQDLALTNPAAPTRGFGGDSNGWTSSRLDLSAFAGKSVRPSFTVAGDGSGSYLGWFLDGIELYTCDPPVAPSAPTDVSVQPWAFRLGATLGWSPPVDPGSGVTGYQVSRSDGRTWTLPVGAPDGIHVLNQTDLKPGSTYTYLIRATGVGGLPGQAVVRTLRGVRATIAASAARVKPRTTVVFKGKITNADTGVALARRPVVLQYREPGTTTWRTLKSPDTGVYAMSSRADGTYRFAPVLRRTRYYRVVVDGSGVWLFAQSGQVRVTVG